MTVTPLKRLAELRVDRARRDPNAVLTLDLIESGTGAYLTDPWERPSVPPVAGVADVEPGDVLFGKLRPYLAKVVHVNRHAYASTELMCLRPKRGVEPRWFFYRMIAQPTVEWSVATSEGTKMPRTSWERLGDFRVEVPSTATQLAIADYLDNETARIEALLSVKRGLFKLLDLKFRILARALTALDDRVQLRRVVRSIRTGTTPAADAMEELGQGADVEWISPGDVGERLLTKPAARRLNGRAVRDRHCPTFLSDSTLVVGIGATAGRIAHLDRVATGNQQMTCIASGDDMLPRFLSWQLWARQDEMRETAPYTTLPILSNEFLRSLEVSWPSPRVQERVVAQLDLLASRTGDLSDALQRQMALLREHRQALITAVVTGEAEVPGLA